MASSAAIPAAYAKFITAVLGEAVAYLSVYGTTWHLQPALVMAGAALAVLGVPNGTAPAAPGLPIPGIRPPEPPSGTVKVRPQGGIVPPSTGPLPDPPAPGTSA